MEDIDKIIKNRIDNYEAQVPDDMWNRVAAQLPLVKEGNRLVPMIWWSIGIIALVMIFTALIFNFKYQNNNLEEDSNTREIQEIVLEDNVSSNDRLITHEVSNELVNDINRTSDKSDNNINRTAVNQKNIEHKNVQTTLKSTPVKSQGANTNIASVETSPINVSETSNKGSIRNIEVQESKMNANNEGINAKVIVANNDYNNDDNSISELKQDIILNQSSSIPEYIDIPSISGLQPNELYSSSINNDGQIGHNDCPDLEEDIGEEHFFMEFHIAPVYNYFSLKSKEAQFDNFSKMRNRSETGRLSYNFGFRAGFKNRNGFNFSTGLDFTQLNTKFNHIDSSATRVVTTIDSIFYPNGDLKSVTEKKVTIYGTNEVRATNYMTMFDIPLLFSYELELSEKSNLNITAGTFLNLGFAHEARIVNSSDIPVWVSSKSEDATPVYKDGLAISLYFSAGYNYRVTDRWRFLVMPNIRYYTEQFTLGTYPLSEDHILLGLRLGMRYDF